MHPTHKILLELKSGLLSELQSDTIFGHFCWRLKDAFGEESLKEFLSFYSNGKPVFTVSDGLFERGGVTFFNKPKMQTPFTHQTKSKKERIGAAILYKELKSRNYITLDQLRLFLNNKTQEYNKSFEDVLEIPSMYSEVRTHVQIDRQISGSAEGKLFTVKPNYITDESFITIFIKEIDKDAFKRFKVLDVFRAIFETGYGKKKSSGFGEFNVVSISEFKDFAEPNDSRGFISFSNYLPSNKDNVSNAFYDINIKYGKLGEEFSNSENPFKKPILFLTAGSCFLTDVRCEFYGRCTEESEITDYNPKVIQSGMAFTLRFN